MKKNGILTQSRRVKLAQIQNACLELLKAINNAQTLHPSHQTDTLFANRSWAYYDKQMEEHISQIEYCYKQYINDNLPPENWETGPKISYEKLNNG